MFTVFVREAIDLDEKHCTQAEYKAKTKKRFHPTDIEYYKKNEQYQQPATEVPDVLGFEAFKFDGLVDALVNGINAN